MPTLAEQLTSVFQTGLENSDEALRKSLSAALSSVNSDSDPIDGISDRYTKSESDYRKAEKKNVRCGKCAHFASPDSCSIVTGRIDTHDVCDYFDTGSSGEVDKDRVQDD